MRHAVLIALLLLVANVASAREPVERTFEHDGQSRHYWEYVPATPARAVLLLLHGHGGSGAQVLGVDKHAAPYRRFIEIADREGLVLLAPDGEKGGDRFPGWNDCRRARSNPRVDDLGFLTALVRETQRREHADTAYVAGTSNGGVMALRLAVERPELFRGVAAIAASMPAESTCGEPRAPVSVIFIAGTADTYMPYDGGAVAGKRGRGSVIGAERSVALWRRVDDAERREMSDRRGAVERSVWRGPRASVALDRVEGGGHSEPSRVERYSKLVTRLLGEQNGDIETADEVWAFFGATRGR